MCDSSSATPSWYLIDSLGPQLLEALPAGSYEYRFENTYPDCPTCALIALAQAKVTDGESIVN